MELLHSAIQSSIKTIKMDRLKLELEDVSSVDRTDERVADLEKAIKHIDNSVSVEHEVIGFDSRKINKDIYRRAWSSLSTIHKMTKVSEYVKNMDLSEQKIDALETILLKMVTSNKLNAKKSVTYCPDKEVIINIFKIDDMIKGL